jgi:hypothetical protein
MAEQEKAKQEDNQPKTDKKKKLDPTANLHKRVQLLHQALKRSPTGIHHETSQELDDLSSEFDGENDA